MMRITGGKATGRVLRVPHGRRVRPTPDRVKQAIFNSLGTFVQEAEVLELFAGSGALGLECLSRGARRVLAIEANARHAAWIQKNLVATGLPQEAFHVRVQDAFAAIRQLAEAGEQFDLILADPPFGPKAAPGQSQSLSQKLLHTPELVRVLRPNGRLVLGHASWDSVEVIPPWKELRVLRHGDSVMRILTVNEASE